MMKKKIGALLMAMVMLLVMLPTTAFAAASEAVGYAHGRDILNDGVVTAQDQLNGAFNSSVDYLSILGITQKTAEAFGKKVREALLDYKLEVDVSSFGIKVNFNNTTQNNAFSALMAHEVFYSYDTFMYDGGNYTWQYRYSDYRVNKMIFYENEYKYTWGEFHGYLNLTNAMMDAMLDGIEGNKKLTDLQKALLVHDRLAEWCEYDYDNYVKDTQKLTALPKESFTAYGVLWKGVGVCQGYAEAYAHLMDRLGIKNRFAQSTQINHIWNIITIGGKEYYVDVTWDDPNWDRYGVVLHTNFLVSYSQLKTDHKATDFNSITTQTSTYDTAFWRESKTAFQLIGDSDIYYIDNEDNADNAAVLRRWTGSSRSAELTINSDVNWNHVGNYTCLSQKQGKLYFSTAKKLWSYDPLARSFAVVFTPSMPNARDCIYGFTVRNEMYLLNLNTNWIASQTTMKNSRYHNVPKAISSLKVNTPPDKTNFAQGTPHFDCAGLTLKATYTDGTTEIFNKGYGLENWSTASLGTKTVTVTYGSFNPTFKMSVLPKSVNASAGVYVKQDGTAAHISWKKVSGTSIRYAVYRSYKSGSKWSSWTKVGTTSSNSYRDTKMPSDKVVRYAVRAYSPVAMSGYTIGKTNLCKVSTPKTTATNASSGIKVSWNKISGATKYMVYRATVKSGKVGSFAKLKTAGKSTTSYADKTAKPGTTYVYAVKAYNGSYTSYMGKSSQIVRLKPVAPKALKAGSGIKVKWSKVGYAKEYVVYRRVNGTSAWKKLGTTKNLYYTDKSAKKGVYYQYNVRAKKGSTLSASVCSKKVKR